MELSAEETERRAEATERLLAEMSAGHRRPVGGSGAIAHGTGARAWWDRSYEQLAGRTPTEALATGDEAAVRHLVADWYRTSDQGTERRRNDPGVVKMIQERTEALRHSA